MKSMSRKLIAPLTVAAMAAAPAYALDVTRSETIAAPPAKVWAAIAPFCSIGDWHPAIAKCTLVDASGRPQRDLALKGGGEIVEQQVFIDNAKMTYTYIIVKSPLPVANYQSTLTVLPDGKGSKVVWAGTFDAQGATDAKAKDVVAGIYESGLKGIAAKVAQ